MFFLHPFRLFFYVIYKNIVQQKRLSAQTPFFVENSVCHKLPGTWLINYIWLLYVRSIRHSTGLTLENQAKYDLIKAKLIIPSSRCYILGSVDYFNVVFDGCKSKYLSIYYFMPCNRWVYTKASAAHVKIVK